MSNNTQYLYSCRPLVYGDSTLASLALGPLIAAPLVGYTVRLHKYFLGSRRREALEKLSAKLDRRDKTDYSSFFKQGPLEYPKATTPEPRELYVETPIRIIRPESLAIHIVDPFKAAQEGARPYIVLDFPPKELSIDIKSDFAAVKILGANNPHYHYGGSEDTITLEVDWYHFARGSQKNSVIEKCRALEALTKADGTRRRPPIIYLQWGVKNPIFRNHFFVMTSASYKLRNFTNTLLASTRNPNQGLNNEGGMLPLYATQTVVLKRVTPHSLTWKEILQ